MKKNKIIQRLIKKNITILFIGTLNDRRTKILDALKLYNLSNNPYSLIKSKGFKPFSISLCAVLNRA